MRVFPVAWYLVLVGWYYGFRKYSFASSFTSALKARKDLSIGVDPAAELVCYCRIIGILAYESGRRLLMVKAVWPMLKMNDVRASNWFWLMFSCAVQVGFNCFDIFFKQFIGWVCVMVSSGLTRRYGHSRWSRFLRGSGRLSVSRLRSGG